MVKRMSGLPVKYQGKTSGLWCVSCGDFHEFEAPGCKCVIVTWTIDGYKIK